MKKLSEFLIAFGIVELALTLLIFKFNPSGIGMKILLIKFKYHSFSDGFYLGLNSIFLGIFLYLLDKGEIDWKLLMTFFFLVTTVLKIIRYDFYMSPGYDLGNYASILYNIHKFGKLWDGLNHVNGFAGHIRPFLYPLSLILYIWRDPRILLILQSLAVSLTIPAIYLLSKLYKIGKKEVSLLMLLFASNIYVHWVNGFDFHLEALAMPLIIVGIYFLEKVETVLFLLIFLTTLTFKEDVAIGWVSVALYYFLVKKDSRKAILIISLSVLYGIVALVLMMKFSNTEVMMQAHYSGRMFDTSKIASLIKFFASFGFIPFFHWEGVVAYILPLLEHILSSRSQHYMLYYQYSSILIPIILWVLIDFLRFRKISHLKYFIALGIIFSFLENPVGKYIDPSKINFKKKVYLDNLIRNIPDTSKIAVGNHISPHLAMKQFVTQFPRIESADYIIIDTTWRDFTPIKEDSAKKLLKSLESTYRTIPARYGILMLKRNSP